MIGLFYEKGWAGTDYMLRIGDVEQIRNQLAYINDWMNLIHCGHSMGTKGDQPKLKKLSKFLQTCSSRKELEGFQIKISTGELGCVMCAETADQLEKMRIVVVSDRNKLHREKLNKLFDRLSQYLSSGENDPDLYGRLSKRQYITTGIACEDYLD